MELCNPSKRELCILTNVKDLAFDLRSNDVSEMTFNVYRYDNDLEFAEYGLVRKMRLVHVENMGYFVIWQVTEVYGDDNPHKEVTCYSAEYMLNYKAVNLITTTTAEGSTETYNKSYKFYDIEYPGSTLIYQLFDASGMTDWTFDYDSIDADLMNKYRSFDDTGDGLYGFLQNYVSTAYDRIFTYDIENYIVSVHKKDDLIKDTDITLSFDNLMKSANMEELSDEIVTVLAVTGSDSLSLSKINPTGTNNIYRFDYYLDEDWLGRDFTVQSIAFDDNYNIIYDTEGNMTYVGMTFIEHVKLWEEVMQHLLYSATEEGSYAWLLKRYTYLNAQYVTVQAYHSYAEYIYNYTTEAIATYQEEAESETEEIKTVEKSGWLTILFGVGLCALVVGAVVLTGGVAVGAFVAGSVTFAEAIGVTGVAGTIANAVASATVMTGVSMISSGAMTVLQSKFALANATYQINVTKEQMENYQSIAQKNIDVYKSGGDYVYNLTPETLVNIMAGTYSDVITDEKLYWVSNTYDKSNETDVYQKKPTDTITDSTVNQIYCLDVLEQKLDYINSKIASFVSIYSYVNWFSTEEKRVLEPFLILGEYTDESFTATEDVDIDSVEDTSTYITTNQGVMTVEEYMQATTGYYIKYICAGDTITYEATPMTFNLQTFYAWIVNYDGYTQYASDYSEIHGHFYFSYDGTSNTWTVSDRDTGSIINSVSGPYPTVCGITQNTHDGKYSYTPVNADYITLNIYSESIEIIDTTTIAVQLAQQAYEVIEECSQPTFSFSIESNNFLLMEEYQEWTNQIGFDGDGLTLGSCINVILDDDTVLQPYVQEIAFEWDSPDSITLTFGNKFNLGSSEYVIGQILAQTTSIAQRTSRSLIGTGSTSATSGYTINALNGSIEETNNNVSNISSQIASINSSMTTLNTLIDNLDSKIAESSEETAAKIDEMLANSEQYTDEQIAAERQQAILDLEEARQALSTEINQQILNVTNRVAEITANIPTKTEIAEIIEEFQTNFGGLVAGGMGLYSTQVTDSTGATIYFYHNAETIAQSSIVYTFRADAYAWWTGLAGTITEDNALDFEGWQYGFTADGSMIMNNIYANKITAEYIEAGSITTELLAAGCVTADKIASQTITADQIATRSIYASNLASEVMFKLLWKNENPTFSFSAQTVSFDSSYSGMYESLIIYGRAVTTSEQGNGCCSTIVAKLQYGTIISANDSSTFWGFLEEPGIVFRKCYYNGAHSVIFSSAQTYLMHWSVVNIFTSGWDLTWTTTNDASIPTYIYGCKYGT